MRSFFPSFQASVLAGLAVAAILAAQPSLQAQVTGNTTTTTDAQGQTHETATATLSVGDKKKPVKTDRVQRTKDTKAAVKRVNRADALVGKDAQLPDKQLYDKAVAQTKAGHFDVARLDLNTLLSTYPDSQYLMRSKLAIADAWYKEGGSAALTQAEQEYTDFITFFPNSPEAAEAQMRIGDIYFKQMDVPDRDYTKATHAEDAYRTMLKQYPDAPPDVLKEAKQKLREVQEVMATREAELAAFYATHSNWPATIARYQTVIDTYPQYSHMDDALIGLGDAYEAEATLVRQQNLPEAARVKLLQEFDGKAADAYRNVVIYHYAAPHVEDAKERLTGMNLPVPKPTAAQVATSEELEGSRAQYNLRNRLALLVLRRPDTVTAAQMGEPPLDDATPTVAPTVVRSLTATYKAAFDPGAASAATERPALSVAPADTATPAPETPVPVSTAPPALSDVPAAGQGASGATTSAVSDATSTPSGSASGVSLGVEILTPGAAATSSPAATGAPDPNYGLTTVGPKDASALPPIEKPADAPDTLNEAAGKNLPAAQAPKADGKKTKAPTVDKADESSSKKKKKGLDKLNPF